MGPMIFLHILQSRKQDAVLLIVELQGGNIVPCLSELSLLHALGHVPKVVGGVKVLPKVVGGIKVLRKVREYFRQYKDN